MSEEHVDANTDVTFSSNPAPGHVNVCVTFAQLAVKCLFGGEVQLATEIHFSVSALPKYFQFENCSVFPFGEMLLLK